jgi:hypothetical protein
MFTVEFVDEVDREVFHVRHTIEVAVDGQGAEDMRFLVEVEVSDSGIDILDVNCIDGPEDDDLVAEAEQALWDLRFADLDDLVGKC